jgi:chitodextrinase
MPRATQARLQTPPRSPRLTPAAPTPTDTTPPSAPSNLTAATAGATEIDLTWTASADNTAVAGYRVYRNGTQIATTGSTSYADTPLLAGAANSYYVVAIDAAYNASTPSNTASASTPAPDTTAPSAPTNVTVAAPAYDATTVTWTASTDNIAVVGYTIRANGSIVAVVDGSTASFVDASTLPSLTYLYTVTAFDAAGNTAQSSSVSVTTPAAAPPPDTTKPTTPTGLTATPAPQEIDLAWSGSTESSGHVAGYNVLRDGVFIATTYSLTCADMGLTPGALRQLDE